ncbi:MAG: hypothetical protein ACLT0Y_06820 [Christensenellales bacterium]
MILQGIMVALPIGGMIKIEVCLFSYHHAHFKLFRQPSLSLADA